MLEEMTTGAVVAAFAGALTLSWNWLKHRSDLANQLAHDRLDAYSGLLAELHNLNNAHSLENPSAGPSPNELATGRAVRDEVWRWHSRILLISPSSTIARADELIKEYHSSSWDRGKRRRPIDRGRREQLRTAFVEAARADLPGGNRKRLR